MFCECEGCINCTEMEDGSWYCERYGEEIGSVPYCEDRDDLDEYEYEDEEEYADEK